jgi:hypothetical protein
MLMDAKYSTILVVFLSDGRDIYVEVEIRTSNPYIVCIRVDPAGRAPRNRSSRVRLGR